MNALGVRNGPATFNVRVRVSDGDGGTTNSSATPLSLSNVAPQNIILNVVEPAGPLVEGTPMVVSGAFSDLGASETYSYLWQVTSTNGQLIANQGGTVLAAGPVPSFNFTPTGDGVYTVQLSIGDGAQTTTSLVALGVGNVSPQSFNLSGPAGEVALGEPVAVTGSFVDPGSDLWQATLVVRNGTTLETLLRLPVLLVGHSFSASFVPSNVGSLALVLEVDDGSGVATSQPILVSVGGGLAGDFDRSGTVNLADYMFWKTHFGETSGLGLQADGNGSGNVDAADYTIWRNNLGATTQPSLAGDFDRNGEVNLADHTFWKLHFGETSGVGLQADGNGNGNVDAADYTVWRNQFNQSPNAGTVSAVSAGSSQESSRVVAVSPTGLATQAVVLSESIVQEIAPLVVVADQDFPSSNVETTRETAWTTESVHQVPDPLFAEFREFAKLTNRSLRRNAWLARHLEEGATDSIFSHWNLAKGRPVLPPVQDGLFDRLADDPDEFALVDEHTADCTATDAAFFDVGVGSVELFRRGDSYGP